MNWVFVDFEIVLALHDRAVSETGEPVAILNATLLRSALARPEQHLAYSGEDLDACTLAAIYLHGIATAHAFENGNKRTAWLTANVFLEMHDYRLDAVPAEVGEAFVLSVIAGRTTIPQAAQFLRRYARSEP